MTFTFTRAKDEVYTNVASIKDVKPIAIPESFTSAKVKGTTRSEQEITRLTRA